MEVNGASAIITGGASGIGAASARRLAKRGARCVIVDRDVVGGPTLASEVGGTFAQADVTSEGEISAAIIAARALGPVRVLVNAAGIGQAGRTIDRHGTPMQLMQFERVVAINLTGTFNCLRLAAEAMAATTPLGTDGCRGAIVNIASVAAFDGQMGQAAYAASKGGVVAMTLPIARDLASVGIRVNTIAPGLIDTPIYGHGDASEALKDRLGASMLYPHRLGTADELASMVLELVANDYVNGETIRVDGGLRLPPK